MAINPNEIMLWIGVLSQLVAVGRVTEQEIVSIYKSLRGSTDVETAAADDALLEEFSQIVAAERASALAAAGGNPGYSFLQPAVPAASVPAALPATDDEPDQPVEP